MFLEDVLCARHSYGMGTETDFVSVFTALGAGGRDKPVTRQRLKDGEACDGGREEHVREATPVLGPALVPAGRSSRCKGPEARSPG